MEGVTILFSAKFVWIWLKRFSRPFLKSFCLNGPLWKEFPITIVSFQLDFSTFLIKNSIFQLTFEFLKKLSKRKVEFCGISKPLHLSIAEYKKFSLISSTFKNQSLISDSSLTRKSRIIALQISYTF